MHSDLNLFSFFDSPCYDIVRIILMIQLYRNRVAKGNECAIAFADIKNIGRDYFVFLPLRFKYCCTIYIIYLLAGIKPGRIVQNYAFRIPLVFIICVDGYSPVSVINIVILKEVARFTAQINSVNVIQLAGCQSLSFRTADSFYVRIGGEIYHSSSLRMYHDSARISAVV